MNARAITWPTVPKGKDRVRVCLHSGNTRDEVERLALALIEWARAERREGDSVGNHSPRTAAVQSKL